MQETPIRGWRSKALQALTMRPDELLPTVCAFSIAFLLMAAYFILRPVRDAMASDWSDVELSALWNLQFVVSTVVVALYGLLVSRARLSLVVPMVYGMFALSFLSFYTISSLQPEWALAEKSFYIWVSAFSILHLSVFWSLMAEVFSKDQARRLFAIIASGASAGAIVGPLVPALLASHVEFPALMLTAAVLLACVIPLVLGLQRRQSTTEHAPRSGRGLIDSNWLGGFRSVIGNPYLLAIAAFLLLYVFVGSFVYFAQKNLLAEFARSDRIRLLGLMDGTVNLLTFVLAFFATSRIITRLGMSATLLVLPLLMCVGMLVLAVAPMASVLVAFQVVRRTTSYSVTRPAREMLFSEVSQDERFKAKPVIDVVVYRGGDAVSGSLFALLSEGIGLGLAALSLVGAGIAVIWAAVARSLGRRYDATSDRFNDDGQRALQDRRAHSLI